MQFSVLACFVGFLYKRCYFMAVYTILKHCQCVHKNIEYILSNGITCSELLEFMNKIKDVKGISLVFILTTCVLS